MDRRRIAVDIGGVTQQVGGPLHRKAQSWPGRTTGATPAFWEKIVAAYRAGILLESHAKAGTTVRVIFGDGTQEHAELQGEVSTPR